MKAAMTLKGSAVLGAGLLFAPMAKADLAHCHLLLDVASGTLGSPVTAGVEAIDGGCLFRDLRFIQQSRAFTSDWAISELVVKGAGLDAFIDAGTPPHALQVQARGMIWLPGFGHPILAWVSEVQQRRNPVSLDFSYAWDEASQEIRIDRGRLVFDPENHIDLTATLSGVDLRDVAVFEMSLGRMGLTALEAEISSHGLFEDLLLRNVAYFLLDGFTDPQAGFEVRRGEAIQFMAEVPEDILDTASRGQIETLLQRLPSPSGVLNLAISAEPGLGLPRFASLALTGARPGDDLFWATLRGVALSASWTDTE